MSFSEFGIIIDLTLPIEDKMPTFQASWHTKVSVSQLGYIQTVGRETRELSLGSHTGTHIDAPLHFFSGGSSVDTIPLSALTGSVSIIDFSCLRKNQAITAEILKGIEITEKMIFYYNWSRYWKTDQYYRDYPFLTVESSQYLISEGVTLLGMDTPSPDDSRIALGSKDDSMVHKAFLSHGVVLVEYLANLDSLPDFKGWDIIALPMKIKGCDGAPARVCVCR
jgi:arylformamidase